MTKVLVLGCRGMLGSMVARTLRIYGNGIEVRLAGRVGDAWEGCIAPTRFDAERDSVEELLESVQARWIVNCIGLVKPKIDESDVTSVQKAIAVNSVFPRRLAEAAAARGQRVIEIATDGVFSGRAGPYDEAAVHDPIDVYGKTKSLGEHRADAVVRLRCSVIGPELAQPAVSLLGWVLGAPPGAVLTGFTNSLWNGITTLHFARLCAAIVAGAPVQQVQHILPKGHVTKADLIDAIVREFGRTDLKVVREPGPSTTDRRLATVHPTVNHALWRAAGYPEPPTINKMVAELAAVCG